MTREHLKIKLAQDDPQILKIELAPNAQKMHEDRDLKWSWPQLAPDQPGNQAMEIELVHFNLKWRQLAPTNVEIWNLKPDMTLKWPQLETKKKMAQDWHKRPQLGQLTVTPLELVKLKAELGPTGPNWTQVWPTNLRFRQTKNWICPT